MKATLLIVGMVLGIVLCNVFSNGNSPPDSLVCVDTVFVNKFACVEQVISKAEYVDLKEQLTEYVDAKKAEGDLQDVGIYFRDLRNGPTMGINEYAEFSTASLLKVPTLIAYLDLAEKDPSVMGQVIALREGFEPDSTSIRQEYAPPEELKKDTPYTVETLLTRLVRYSDNVASEMLRAYLDVIMFPHAIDEVYRELGLVPKEGNGDYVISVKRYASIFRILYNASYLSVEMSEKALQMLSTSAFDVGLVAGVPEGTVVAHKFGERSVAASEQSREPIKQLHDCGIIYFPDNPYTLCVMTLGTDFSKLETVISDVSRMVYSEVQSRVLPEER